MKVKLSCILLRRSWVCLLYEAFGVDHIPPCVTGFLSPVAILKQIYIETKAS